VGFINEVEEDVYLGLLEDLVFAEELVDLFAF
jgi:hypothetical protein